MREIREQLQDNVVRRAVAVTSAAGLAGVLAGVIVLANPATARSAPDPAAGPHGGIVVDVGDAQAAVEGTDYRVVDRNHRKETDEDDKVIAYSGFTPDGTGVGFVPYGGRLLQMDLSNPVIRDELPVPPERADVRPIHVSDDKLVFRTGEWDALLVFDRDTRQWDRLAWSGLPRGSWPAKLAVGSDNRVYIAVAQDGAPDGILELWSIALDDATDVRDEHETVGSIARSGSSLVWTDPAVKKTPYLHFRDLATGTERTVDTGTDRTCAMAVAPSGSQDVILTHSECDDGHRVTAYTPDGTPQVTVTGANVSAVGVNDTHLLISTYTATYTADLDTGRLLKVSDESTRGGAFLSGSYVFWHEPTPDTSVIQVVAEMN